MSQVYTVGPDYAHAEARKSPALDGKVERDSEGKEIRYPVMLTAMEKLVARKVCLAFKVNLSHHTTYYLLEGRDVGQHNVQENKEKTCIYFWKLYNLWASGAPLVLFFIAAQPISGQKLHWVPFYML